MSALPIRILDFCDQQFSSMIRASKQKRTSITAK